MDDELQKLFDKRRKRKYLKCEVPVPKRTKKHWKDAKDRQQAEDSSQNVSHEMQSSSSMGDVDEAGSPSPSSNNSGSSSSPSEEAESISQRQRFGCGIAELPEEESCETQNRNMGGSPGSSPSSSDSESDAPSSSSLSSENQGNIYSGSDQETRASDEQEDAASEQEIEQNEDNLENERSEENLGNEQNEENLENERNEENLGNEQNGENLDNERNEENLGNEQNEEDLGNERNEENGDFNDQNQRPRSNLQEWIDSPIYNETITAPVNVSKLDLLYMALGSARQNKDTNKAFNDSVKLLNNVFVRPVLPTSPYLIDKLVMSHLGIRLFFFCEECFHDFGELDHDNVKDIDCPTCNTNNQISDLRIAHYFCLFNIKFALEAIFNNEEIRQSILTPREAVQTTPDDTFTDIYSGSMYKKFAENLGNAADHVISFQVNTDGSSLFSSSACSIWPIALALNELPLHLRLNNIICAGLWFGKKTPPMDLFLTPFVSHMRELAQGFQIRVGADNWNMCAYVIGVSVDSGARGAVQGLKKHSGYNSCSWCSIHGVFLAGAVRFPLTDIVHRLRCHDDIVRMQYGLVDEEHLDDDISDDEDEAVVGGGVNAVSPLINLPGLDMVDGFFVEAMHCVHLGVTKYAMLKWLEDVDCEWYVKNSENEINRRIRSLRPPIDCRRMPRTLDEKARYKARELENLLLFCIVPVFTNILPNKHIKIWLLFAQGIYLLYLTAIRANLINTADALLKKFLVQWQETYGEASMTFNLHLLYHLAEHVARWGNVFASSAYCFESFIGRLKNVIRSRQGIPNQVVRSLSWEEALTYLKPHVSEKARTYVESSIASKKKAAGLRVGPSVLSGKPKLFSPNAEERWLCERKGIDVNSCDQYGEVIHNKCVFAPDEQTSQTNNSMAQLNDNQLVLIRKIVFDRVRSIIFLFVSRVHFQPLLEDPDIALDRDDHLMRLITHVEPNCILIESIELKIVCFRAEFNHGDFVAPLPNVCNRQ